MSINNFYFARQINDKWYGWDEMAETWQEPGKPIQLRLSEADATADSIEELEQMLDERGMGFVEYGITTQPYLPKDGTPIEVIEDDKSV